MHDARVIANEVLLAASQAGVSLTQIDIQKICYFLNGHHLIDYGEPLIATEFEAWDYGPVQPSVYTAFKKYGREPIEELATAFDPIKRQTKVLPRLSSNSARATIDKYLERYLSIPSFELVEMTHAPGTPWSETLRRAETSANMGLRISEQIIKERFEGVALG